MSWSVVTLVNVLKNTNNFFYRRLTAVRTFQYFPPVRLSPSCDLSCSSHFPHFEQVWCIIPIKYFSHVFIGPMGHLLHGVHEQTHVPFAMAYSLCIGPYETKCRKGGGGGGDHHSKGHGHPAGKTNGGSTPSIARNNNNLWLLTTTTVFLLAISHTC